MSERPTIDELAKIAKRLVGFCATTHLDWGDNYDDDLQQDAISSIESVERAIDRLAARAKEWEKAATEGFDFPSVPALKTGKVKVNLRQLPPAEPMPIDWEE